MTQDINIQFQLLTYALLIGFYLGVTYDLFEIFILKHMRKMPGIILQLLFFVVQARIVFLVLYEVNNGLIPFYVYPLFFVGFLIYHRFSSRYHQVYYRKVEWAVSQCSGFVKRLISFLIMDPLRDVMKGVNSLIREVKKVGVFLSKRSMGVLIWSKRWFLGKGIKQKMKRNQIKT